MILNLFCSLIGRGTQFFQQTVQIGLSFGILPVFFLRGIQDHAQSAQQKQRGAAQQDQARRFPASLSFQGISPPFREIVVMPHFGFIVAVHGGRRVEQRHKPILPDVMNLAPALFHALEDILYVGRIDL